ncbi:MAG: ATP-binding protein [Mycobacterium sp.]
MAIHIVSGRVDRIEVRVPARTDSVGFARMIVTAIAAFEDLDLASVADLRLAVDEACARLLESAVGGGTLLLVVTVSSESVDVELSTVCRTAHASELIDPAGFSWYLLRSLTDHVEVFEFDEATDGTRTLGISMTTNRRN